MPNNRRDSHQDDLADIRRVIDDYQLAANSRDTMSFRRLLALDDTRFTEIEDHIPQPFGADVANDILQWIDDNPAFEYTVAYRDIQAYLLSEDSAYAVAMNDWESPGGVGSGRATFVLVRDAKHGWRILHGHWSAVTASDE